MCNRNIGSKKAFRVILKAFNAPGRIRTCITLVVRKELYPLSYRGVKFDYNYIIN